MAEIRSMELLLIQARVELEDHRRLYEATEARAGIALGFAGVLIALLHGQTSLAIAGVVAAILAALSSMWTLLPRLKPDLDLIELQRRYASSEVVFTYSALLDTQISSWKQLARAVSAKTTRLRLSLGFLASSMVILALDRVLR